MHVPWLIMSKLQTHQNLLGPLAFPVMCGNAAMLVVSVCTQLTSWGCSSQSYLVLNRVGVEAKMGNHQVPS